MAKSCADLPEDDEELRKKLWLKIAKHVVQKEEDVKKAMNCLSSCNLLKIEDILPFFPDFVTIDHFKVLNTHTHTICAVCVCVLCWCIESIKTQNVAYCFK